MAEEPEKKKKKTEYGTADLRDLMLYQQDPKLVDAINQFVSDYTTKVKERHKHAKVKLHLVLCKGKIEASEVRVEAHM